MTILVTGGTGFLGQHLLERLRGRPVRALVRKRSRAIEKLGFEQVLGDVEDAASVDAAMQGVTHVVHLAGLVSRNDKDTTRMMRVHVDGSRHVFRAAVAARVARVILASSSGTVAAGTSDTFMGTSDGPFATDVVKGWPYYLSKIYQEQLALRFHKEDKLPVVILNPSLLLGPGDARGSSTEDVLRFLQRKIPSTPEGGVNFVDVRDTADAFVAALEKGEPGERYLMGGPNWTVATFFGRLERLSKVPAPKLKLPASWQRTGATILEEFARWRGTTPAVDRISVEMGQHYWYCDSSKAERVLGFHQRDPQDTLMDTIRYLRKHFLGESEDASLGDTL